MQARFVFHGRSSAGMLAALLLSALWASEPVGAQQAETGALAVDAGGAKLSGVSGNGAPAEAGTAASGGIRVHGHWVIDVRNPDGTVAEHREFDNSLVTGGSLVSGAELLAGLLTGNLSAGDPAIGFVQGTLGSDPSTYCNSATPVSTNTTCYGLSGSFGPSTYLPNFQAGLSTSYTFSPAVKLVLTGNFQAPPSLTSISAVQTLFTVCVANAAPFSVSVPTQGEEGPESFKAGTYTGRTDDIAPARCNPLGTSATNGLNGLGYRIFGTLTSATLTPAVKVQTDQVITATVTISFS